MRLVAIAAALILGFFLPIDEITSLALISTGFLAAALAGVYRHVSNVLSKGH